MNKNKINLILILFVLFSIIIQTEVTASENAPPFDNSYTLAEGIGNFIPGTSTTGSRCLRRDTPTVRIKHVDSVFNFYCPDNGRCLGSDSTDSPLTGYCDGSYFTASMCLESNLNYVYSMNERVKKSCPSGQQCVGYPGYAYCTPDYTPTETPIYDHPLDGIIVTFSRCINHDDIKHINSDFDLNCPLASEECTGTQGSAYCKTSGFTASSCGTDNTLCNLRFRDCESCESYGMCKGAPGYAYCDPDAVPETPTIDCSSYSGDTLKDCPTDDCEIVEEVCVDIDSGSDGPETTPQGVFESFENICLFTRHINADGTTGDVVDFNNPLLNNPLIPGGFTPPLPIIPPPTPTPLPGTCTVDTDCTDGQKCINSACVTAECTPETVATDCEEGETCENYICIEGDPEPIKYEQCPDPDTFEDTYLGVIFTIPEDTVLNTRDRQFQDSLGDYPDDFEFGYDVELEILDSADRLDECWFFIRALEIYDGDEPEFYVKFNDIEEFIDLTECETDDECDDGYYCTEEFVCEEIECEVDSDCDSGYYCEDNSCIEADKDILALVGFYPVLNEEISDAKELGALSIGYYDSENTNDLDIDDNRLDLLIKTDDSLYREDDEILFDDVDFNDMLYVNSAVKAYWIINNPCDEDVDVDDLVELYNMFIEENSEIPVAINFDTLDCALSYVEDTDEQFTDIILFNLEDVETDSEKAEEILDASTHRIKIIPLVNVMQNNVLMQAEEIKDLGLSILDKSFFGLIFTPYDKISAVKDKINYKNAFKEVFCEADETYHGKKCNFKPEIVEPVKIAFIGNTGVNENSKKVLELINKEKADLVVHLGNLGYDSTPSEFTAMLTEKLSEDISFLAVIGNKEFVDGNWDAYSSLLEPFSENLDCEGLYGNKMVCYVDGVSIILSGIGTDFMTQGHETFITEKLSVASDWTVCAWHKANNDLRISNKDDNDNLGINYYNLCKNSQAIIASGYDMAYARTKLLTSLNPITSENIIDLSKGSFAFVSGLGGNGYDRYDCTLHDSDTWWASLYSSNIYKNTVGASVKSCEQDVVPNLASGAMFITFNYKHNPNVAKAEFITTNDEIIDSFYIYSNGYEEVDESIEDDNEDEDDESDDETTEEECIPAGTSFNPSIGPSDPHYGQTCCEGLDIMTPMAKYNSDCSENALVGYSVVCSDCGNGVCDTGENKCACPSDCN